MKFQPAPDPDFIENKTLISPLIDPTPGQTLGISEESGDLLNEYLKSEFSREAINASNSLQCFKTISKTHTNIYEYNTQKTLKHAKTCNL